MKISSRQPQKAKVMAANSRKVSVQCCWLHLHLILVLFSGFANSQSIIETLPGFPGPLPFKLETGYIGVGENDELQLFYYFIESESQPKKDPLLLWLTGGPGCSGFSGLVYEIGPLAFDNEDLDGSFPSLTINPYSWTKLASIIFIDSPVGTGFSYSTSSEGYYSNDTNSTKYIYLFLKKWLSIHPMFSKNWLYVAGDSYGGKIVPMVALEIALVNEDGFEPIMLLQGYIIGNIYANENKYKNEIVPYKHRMALISDEYFELAKTSCEGEYVNPDPSNILCFYAIQLIEQCTKNVNTPHILEPKCKFMSPPILLGDDPVGLLFPSKDDESWCRNYNYVSSYVWANNETVREALHVRKGTKADWKRCNKTLSYERDVESVLKHHHLLSEKGFQALVYSGDHDMVVPYMSTLRWIRQLNLTLDENWRAWTVEGQVAGYTERYKNNQAYLIFATIKGAGHTAPEYKPKECFAMIKRWLSLYPL